MTTQKKAAKKAATTKKAVKANRSAKTGRFVDKATAKANPDTTVSERIR